MKESLRCPALDLCGSATTGPEVDDEAIKQQLLLRLLMLRVVMESLLVVELFHARAITY